MSKKLLMAIIIAVAILSTLTTKAIERSGGLESYVINIVHAVVGEVREVVE